MSEPLKDKEWNLNNIRTVREKDLSDYTMGFHSDDIKSAVEWLKERVLDLPVDDRIGYTTGQKWFLDLINKAFEDVTQNTNKTHKD